MARGEGIGVTHVEEVDRLTDLSTDEIDDGEGGEVGSEDEDDGAEVDGEEASVGAIIEGAKARSAEGDEEEPLGIRASDTGRGWPNRGRRAEGAKTKTHASKSFDV